MMVDFLRGMSNESVHYFLVVYFYWLTSPNKVTVIIDNDVSCVAKYKMEYAIQCLFRVLLRF